MSRSTSILRLTFRFTFVFRLTLLLRFTLLFRLTFERDELRTLPRFRCARTVASARLKARQETSASRRTRARPVVCLIMAAPDYLRSWNTTRPKSLGGTTLNAASLKDGARFQVNVATYCGRASSVNVVSTSFRGSG